MIEWLSKSQIKVRGSKFALASFGAPPTKELRIMKERFQINCYESLAKEIGPDANIVELGIRTGGSTAFLAVLFQPRILTAIEIDERASNLFNEFLACHPDGSRIRTHFECDQGDVVDVKKVLEDDFGKQPIDMVIDDASHRLEPSTISFNILFPRIRPGGIFVIEDWSWEHYAEGQAGPDHLADQVTGFARLALEASLVCAHRPDVIAKVVLMRGIAIIYRGPVELAAEGFSISELLGERGKKLFANSCE